MDNADQRNESPTIARNEPVGHDSPESGKIGEFRLLRKIGEGGMGEVYLAEQERPIRRRVALKLIKSGMDSEQIVARFESERRALALMDHPAIVRVFDGGVTPSGRPYFAMEFVEGEAVTRACDSRRLNTKQRVELFVRVCEGVQHAHQKGVIHGHIKPSNVLVNWIEGAAAPKILDFGVATAVALPLTERSAFTRVAQRIGTSEYLSPEQADTTRVDIDTRSDLYSLGVLLYELLVGVRPFDAGSGPSATPEQLRQRIRHDRPPPPSAKLQGVGDASVATAASRSTDRSTLRKQLQGDLDWIVLKALEKDRARRYPSVSDLIAELRRYLSDEPVLARPPSRSYRLRKFILRNKTGVAAALTALFALTAGAILTTAGVVRAARAEAQLRADAVRARQEADAALRVSDFLVGMFEVVDQTNGRDSTITAREMLQRGAARVRTELQGEPLVQARLLAAIGNVYRGLGLYDEARAELETSFALREQHLQPNDPAIAAGLDDLGHLLQLSGEFEQSRSLFERGLSSREQVLGPEHPDVADSLNNLANLLSDMGDYSAARPLFERALAIRERALGDHAPEVAATLSNLAIALKNTGELEAATRIYERALAIDRAALGDDHPEVATDLDDLGSLMALAGKNQEAAVLFEEALAVREKTLGPQHPHVANSLDNLARLALETGDDEAARTLFERALAIYENALGPEHPDVAGCLTSIGKLLSRSGRARAALPLFERAFRIRESALPANHPATAETLEAYSAALRSLGHRGPADRLDARAMRIRAAASGRSGG